MGTTDLNLSEGFRRLQAFRQQHVMAEIAIFFTAGFLFDIVTLGRVDDLFNIVQQGLYLVLLGWLMVLDERYESRIAAPPRWLAKAWVFSEDAIHFLFGSLLSSFTLFYLKSSSGFSAILFMSVLCALLVANELPRFREKGPIVRYVLLSLCITSYIALLLPVLFGFIRRWLFVTAVLMSCAAIYWLVRTLARWTGDSRSIQRRVAVPALTMQVFLVAAYFAGIIPPVPLSVQFIGIYHEVVPPGAQAATDAGDPAVSRSYELKHQRPWWKVWHQGDQDFAARPGDVVHCFARVFAPNRFRDAIYVHWWMLDQNGEWQDRGRTQLDIRGGRADGFRAFATKKNYEPGRWRVEIETADARDIGVIEFDLIEDLSSDPRSFLVDRS